MKIAMIIGGVGSRVGIPGVWRPDIREGRGSVYGHGGG